ncbi:MAG: hypothetical protein A2W30_05655 [Ignavibacteria bacterium RBG_16_36_9]|nr:MAG: hypothetical protein A2W30_05655 [Ignavibacteria bacterium RBG_16_36_9]
MKFIKFFKQSHDILLALTPGAITMIFIALDVAGLPLWFTGLLFVFLLNGYPLASLIFQNSTLLDKFIGSACLSLLMTYPASVITTMIEGQSGEAIYSRHLPTSFSVLFFLSLIQSLFVITRRRRVVSFQGILKRILKSTLHSKGLVLALIVYSVLVGYHLNRADVLGDEYDLAYQAYDLVDGIFAGRKAFFISNSGHPPLALTIKHFSMNILNPNGLASLSDWQFRVSEAIIGLFTIVAAYVLTKNLYSPKVAILTALFLAVNNYMVWMGRIFHREMVMTFFVTAGIAYYVKIKNQSGRKNDLFVGIALGAALLVKATALITLLIPLIDGIRNQKGRKSAFSIIAVSLAVFLPIIVYNIFAVKITGYADVFFSNIFGIFRPGSTPRSTNFLENLISFTTYLSDIVSPIMFLAYAVSLLYLSIRRKISSTLYIWIAGTVIFYIFSAIRAYYFLFLIIPLTIVTSTCLSMLKTNLKHVMIFSLLVISGIYSIWTNHLRSYAVEISNKPDGPVKIQRKISLPYSIAARSWSEEYGYKTLQKQLDNKLTDNDCLELVKNFETLAARRYFGFPDKVKEHYLGKNYPSRYNRCNSQNPEVYDIEYLLSTNSNEPMKLAESYEDHLHNTRFYLYQMKQND